MARAQESIGIGAVAVGIILVIGVMRGTWKTVLGDLFGGTGSGTRASCPPGMGQVAGSDVCAPVGGPSPQLPCPSGCHPAAGSCFDVHGQRCGAGSEPQANVLSGPAIGPGATTVFY